MGSTRRDLGASRTPREAIPLGRRCDGRRRARWRLGALGASLVAGHRSPGQPVVAQGSLRALQAPPSATGTVTVLAEGTTRHMIVRTRDLSTPSSQESQRGVVARPGDPEDAPGGALPPTGDGDYAVTAGIMAGYSAVDVSLQRDDGGTLAHSWTSVLRAALSV